MGLIQIVGLFIIVLVLSVLCLQLFGAVQRLVHQRTVQHLESALFQERLATAVAARCERETLKYAWEGFRKFIVHRKVEEATNISSFYLKAHDGRPLPAFDPGQFLTFRVQLAQGSKPVMRCYSLSDGPNNDYYRVTIKKVLPAPGQPLSKPGQVSSFFHEKIEEGHILDVQAPRGQFVLDLARNTPIVLVAGGIGITPMLSMINAVIAKDARRQVWLFYGVRNSKEHAMKEYLARLAKERPNIRIRICYSAPLPEDKQGKDYDFPQQISLALLQKELGSSNFEFYICGPPAMMAGVGQDLKNWGVPESKIFSEAFGPASLAKPKPVAVPAEGTAPAAAGGTKVRFTRSEKSAVWNPADGVLLDFAESQGVDIPSGCRAGNCGTCETAVRSGQVRNIKETGWKVQAGTCLVCIAVPNGDVELDA
jgi:ferredoxin-NADP reductase